MVRPAFARNMTADELFSLPKYNGRSDKRYELMRGRLRVMEPVGFEHGYTAVRLAGQLMQYVEEHQLGAVGVEIGCCIERNPDTVLGPDLAFITRDRLPPEAQIHKFFDGAPDLAVEIVSPDDSLNGVQTKAEQYLAAGTIAVWVVDPRRRTVTVHATGAQPVTLTGSAMLHGGAAVPGFSVRITDIFSSR